MTDYRYIPITGGSVKTYIFRAELAQEEDGRWSAWIAALPGCAVWGYTQAEALAALKEAAQGYIEVLQEKGQRVPAEKAVETLDTPAVAITV